MCFVKIPKVNIKNKKNGDCERQNQTETKTRKTESEGLKVGEGTKETESQVNRETE